MGDPLSFAASLLGIASFGISMVTTLSTFTLSYTSASKKILSLSADISVTSSILTSLGNTIQEYEAEFHFKIDNFENAKAACERNFNNLGKAIKAVKRDKIKDVIGKKTWWEAEVGVWEKLKFALGGEQNLKDLVVSIETSKSTLQLLLDSVNLLILKRLSKNQLLNEDQADDLKLLVHHLPVLLKSIQQAGLVPLFVTPEKKKDVVQVVEETHLDSKPVELEQALLPVLTQDFDAPTSMSANIHHDESKLVFHMNDNDPPKANSNPTAAESERLDSNPPPGMSERGISHPTSLIVSSPLGTLEDTGDVSFSLNPNVYEIDNESQHKPTEDGIVPPVTEPDPTYNPLPRPPPLLRPLRHITSPLPSRNRTPSLYEGWLLKPIPNKGEPALILFCGLKIHFYPPTDSPSYQRIPFSLDDEMLKKRAELVNTKFKEVSKQGGEIPNTIEQEIATLPENVKLEVGELLEARNHAATRGYGWKVLSIETLSKKYRRSFFTRKSTPQSPPIWLVILHGGVATKIKKESGPAIALPDIYSNPWGFHLVGRGAVECPSANAAPSPTFTDSSFTSFLNPTGRNYSSSRRAAQRRYSRGPPPRERSHGALLDVAAGASIVGMGVSKRLSYHPADDFRGRSEPRAGVVERPVVVERVTERQPSFEPRVSDAHYGDASLSSSTEPDSARDTGNHIDVERLMDQFLKTFVEDGEGDNE